jgi:hypothetical protein
MTGHLHGTTHEPTGPYRPVEGDGLRRPRHRTTGASGSVLTLRKDLDVPDSDDEQHPNSMDWQPHVSSSGAVNSLVHPDLKRNTLFDVPGSEEQGRPELAKLTNFRIPSTEERRPELAKLNNFKIPGPEGQGPPAMPQSTTANVPSVVDPSARNDGDIDLEYR